MILDPRKKDLSKTQSLLKDLSRLTAPLRAKGARDWAAETSKTLQAGRLEDFDLAEFVVAAYETDLAERQDPRPVWEYSRALLGLIEELERLGSRSERATKVREALSAWSV